MITLMSASAARKESELNMNMKSAAKKQWEKIENLINAAVRAGEFHTTIKDDIYDENIKTLENLKYAIEYVYNINEKKWCWQISW